MKAQQWWRTTTYKYDSPMKTLKKILEELRGIHSELAEIKFVVRGIQYMMQEQPKGLLHQIKVEREEPARKGKGKGKGKAAKDGLHRVDNVSKAYFEETGRTKDFHALLARIKVKEVKRKNESGAITDAGLRKVADTLPKVRRAQFLSNYGLK